MMTTPEATIIIPTRGRHHLLPRRLRTIYERTPELSSGRAEMIIVVDEDEEDKSTLYTSGEFNGCRVTFTPKLALPCKKWNEASKHSLGNWLVTLTDDCEPTQDWLSYALDQTLNQGFVGLPDEMRERNNYFTPIYMATKEWLVKYNGAVLVIPMYMSWYADIETCERAHRSGTYVISPRSQVRQLHADFATAPDDEMYRLGKTRRHVDKITFDYRKRHGFPDDFDKEIEF